MKRTIIILIILQLEIYLKTLPGKWINKDTKQKVQIFKHSIETYIAEYDPPLQLTMEVQNEEIKIIQLPNEYEQ